MTFDEIWNMGDWRPIRDCPGRYVLRGASPELVLAELISGAEIQSFESPHARDKVFVARLANGGIISYQRSAHSWLHTLCTAEGFQRKLRQLEIGLDPNAA